MIMFAKAPIPGANSALSIHENHALIIEGQGRSALKKALNALSGVASARPEEVVDLAAESLRCWRLVSDSPRDMARLFAELVYVQALAQSGDHIKTEQAAKRLLSRLHQHSEFRIQLALTLAELARDNGDPMRCSRWLDVIAHAIAKSPHSSHADDLEFRLDELLDWVETGSERL